MTDRNGTSIETKIEIVRIQLLALEKVVVDGREETRGWREEIKRDGVTTWENFTKRMDQHDTSDERYHSDSNTRIDRLENQTLEAGKMMIQRVEALERVDAATPNVQARLVALETAYAAREAITKYQHWLIGSVVVAGFALLLNALRLFEPVLTLLLHGPKG